LLALARHENGKETQAKFFSIAFGPKAQALAIWQRAEEDSVL
jgi:hypothetical protein